MALTDPLKITLDFYNHNLITVNAKQYDTLSRYINITCSARGKKMTLDSAAVSAIVCCKKPDGNYVLNDVTVQPDGTLLLELTQQMLAVKGKCLTDIIVIGAGNIHATTFADIEELYTSNTEIITTMSFYLNVIQSASDGSNIESSYEYNALIDGLARLTTIENTFVPLASKGEPNGVATLGSNAKVPSKQLDIVANVTTTETGRILDASIGKKLQDEIDAVEEVADLTDKDITTTVNENGHMVVVDNGVVKRLSISSLRDYVIENVTTYINVARELGYGTSNTPIDLTSLGITDFTTLYFPKGTYYIQPLTLRYLTNVTFLMTEAKIMLTGTYWVYARGCTHFTVIGGEINGNNTAQYGMQLEDCPMCVFKGVTFADMGNVELADTCLLRLYGDCTGFIVENCIFDGCTSGQVYDDGFIHSYGLFINRLGSSKTYSKSGTVIGCSFKNITSTDTTSTKGDGDGIFIQAAPYESGSEIITPICKIHISNCTFEACKKRGVKSAIYGVTIDNCRFEGDFWYACVDMQYGHTILKNSRLINTSDYTGSITSAVVTCDGGIIIDNCYLSAPYSSDNHPGIRLHTRLGANVFGTDVPWDTCKINNCHFDKVSRGLYVYTGTEGAATYILKGLEVTNCRWGIFNKEYGIQINTEVFESIGSLKFTDFQFDYGYSRSEVREVFSKFVYPIHIEIPVTNNFEVYSAYWKDDPMSGYADNPTSVHARIVYEGNMSGITYKEFTAHGSRLRGTKNPADYTATMALQCLYNSKVGDIYTNTSNGTIWFCIGNGTESTIGTWTQLLTDANALGGAS